MKNTRIEWSDHTWNFVVGCTQVSAGCDHCYALALHERHHRAWKEGRAPNAPPQYHEPFSVVQVIPSRLPEPASWQKPARIFVNSLADLYHVDVPVEVLVRAFAIMATTPRHTYQILTKRPGRQKRLMESDGFELAVLEEVERLRSEHKRFRAGGAEFAWEWPLPNVWLGVSVENMDVLWRAETLCETPAALRFLSCEPLLGPLDLRSVLWEEAGPEWAGFNRRLDGIDWVIVGGESGAGHRPIDPDWVRSLRHQAEYAGVPFFFKQYGGYTAKAGGRLLDGREWLECPPLAHERIPA